MASAFVKLAKLKLEQKPKPERREKKKSPVKRNIKLPPTNTMKTKRLERRYVIKHKRHILNTDKQ